MLLGLPDVRVETVERDQDRMTVTVSTPWQLMGCPDCGVVAPSRGRRRRVLHDVPHGDARARLDLFGLIGFQASYRYYSQPTPSPSRSR